MSKFLRNGFVRILEGMKDTLQRWSWELLMQIIEPLLMRWEPMMQIVEPLLTTTATQSKLHCEQLRCS